MSSSRQTAMSKNTLRSTLYVVTHCDGDVPIEKVRKHIGFDATRMLGPYWFMRGGWIVLTKRPLDAAVLGHAGPWSTSVCELSNMLPLLPLKPLPVLPPGKKHCIRMNSLGSNTITYMETIYKWVGDAVFGAGSSSMEVNRDARTIDIYIDHQILSDEMLRFVGLMSVVLQTYVNPPLEMTVVAAQARRRRRRSKRGRGGRAADTTATTAPPPEEDTGEKPITVVKKRDKKEAPESHRRRRRTRAFSEEGSGSTSDAAHGDVTGDKEIEAMIEGVGDVQDTAEPLDIEEMLANLADEGEPPHKRRNVDYVPM